MLLQLVPQEQRQDQELAQLMDYFENRSLLDDVQAARHITGQDKKGCILIDVILYYEGVVPAQLQ